MEIFTPEETERLNKVLSIEVNPYLHGDDQSLELSLGKVTRDWLFKTHLNLPSDMREDLEPLKSDETPVQIKIQLLNEALEQRQFSSAPKWWELNFFDVNIAALWTFFVEQCRRNYRDEELQEYFNLLVASLDELEEARHILMVSKVNEEKYSEAEILRALEVVDRSYPLDFSDYEEVPQKVRSPLAKLQELITSELNDVGDVFSKRWFEFKILDELASFRSFVHDGSRDSELSRKIAGQLRHYMYGKLLALGRMVEHYRWKFSYEKAALKGIQSTNADRDRGRKGGEASGRLKRQNLECFMDELEKLGDLFPRMSEDAIFSQAYQNAGEKRKMPKSQRVIDDYGTQIRSDPEFKSRYQKIFKKNA